MSLCILILGITTSLLLTKLFKNDMAKQFINIKKMELND